MANPARFTAVANLGRATIPTTSAQVKSNGVSAGSGTDMMYKVFTAGTYDSYLEKIRFMSVASAAATTGVATVLRAYISTVAAPGATTAADTFLIGEISVGAVVASHSTSMAAFFDMPIDMVIPTGSCVHVSQHVAQTTNQNWIALAIGGDYAAA